VGGSENSDRVTEHELHSPKVKVWCALTRNKVIGPFIFYRNEDEWWQFSDNDGEHCFPSCPWTNSFPVTWYTTSILQSCSCLYEQTFSWYL